MAMRGMSRREFLMSAVTGTGALLVPSVSFGEDYPSRAIKIIVGFAAGGTTDVLPRIVQQPMSAALGQPLVIENKVGAAGNIATAFVAQAKPDGYTLLASSVGQIVVSPLTSDLSVDPLKDLVHISSFGEGDQYLTIPAALPVKNYADFVTYAKQHPDKLFHGDSGAGGNMHLYLEYYKLLAGLKMEAVHFKGGSQIVLDLIANRVQMSLLTYGVIDGYVKDGKLRPILVLGKQRDTKYPDLPTVAEVGLKPLEACSNWFGLHAPHGTPEPIVRKLQASLANALKTEEAKKGMASVMISGGGDTPEHFAARIASEYEVFKKVAQQTGVRAA